MKVGIIGAGRMGQLHARTLAEFADAPSLLIHDSDHATAEYLVRSLNARASGAATTRTSCDAVLADADALVIATPATQRRTVLEAAGRARLPVFCEKPLTADVEEARVIAAALSGTRIHVGFQRRCDPAYRTLHEEITSGRLGRILMVRCTAFDHQPPAGAYEQTAGDIFTDCLIHDIDAMHWLIGQPTVAVQADSARQLGDGAEFDVATVQLTLADGTRAVLCASRLNPHGYDHRIEVLGTKGSLAVGLDEQTPLRPVAAAGGSVGPAPHSPYRDFTDRFAVAYEHELRAFLRMVTHGDPSPCTAREALLAQEVAAAASRSARTGTRVAPSGRCLHAKGGKPSPPLSTELTVGGSPR
ncbi:Gfo/Idh/MocA family oxidoreductase [Streptomyces platensis]|uniref:Gfo/Idh/MocA family protein n=1 Tax=Streptomyces platensis TaxID=58346 RepID=UPI002E810F4A|nr:Gfo/Idh/MocA family oxidoreductase [Streptomyces platensis]WTI55459.1 Gfo/Idh/MocA family oxidoreductase [Streptomyces platensis]WUB78960.1 Gfo/Idh/MocA family oxidoreductase [Streptomyces platensis]